jgi:hypothetical protein
MSEWDSWQRKDEPEIVKPPEKPKRPKRKKATAAPAAKRGRPATNGTRARDVKIAALVLPLTDGASKAVARENAGKVIALLVETHGYSLFSEVGSDGE